MLVGLSQIYRACQEQTQNATNIITTFFRTLKQNTHLKIFILEQKVLLMSSKINYSAQIYIRKPLS